MPTSATMSVLGLYIADPTIFNGLEIPESRHDADLDIDVVGVDREALVNMLLAELSDMEVLYPDPDVMRGMIQRWSRTKIRQWDKLNTTLYLQFNPIHNFDRYESWDDENTETRNLTSNADSSSGSAVAAYNAGDLQPNAAANSSGTNSETGTIGTKKSSKGRTYGNVGVTTSTQMLEDYRRVESDFNIYDQIISDFKCRFCLLVY